MKDTPAMPAPAPADPSKRTLAPKRRVWRRIGQVILILLGLAVAAHAIWGYVARQRLDKAIAELRNRGEPIDASGFVEPEVPDAQNAALDFLAAGKLIDIYDPEWDRFTYVPIELPLEPAEVELVQKVVKAKRPALDLLASAGRKPKVRWGIDPDAAAMFSKELPGINRTRAGANLLARAALLCHEQGDDAQALEYLRQMLAISRAVDRQNVLVSHLVAIGVRAMTCEAATQIAPDLRIARDGNDKGAVSPQQVRSLIDDLLDDAPSREGLLGALRRERLMFVQMSDLVVRGDFSLFQSNQPKGSPSFGRKIAGYVMAPPFRDDTRFGMGVFTDWIDAHAGATDLATYRKAVVNQTWEREIEDHRWRHVLSSILLPSLGRVSTVQYRDVTERRLAALTLAIRAYAVDHDGQRPPALEALAPRYIAVVPRDPFAPAPAPLGYRATGDKPILYSVGEDGMDDGGSAELSPRVSRKGRSPNSYSRWDCKDVVGHLTRQPRTKVEPPPTGIDDPGDPPAPPQSQPAK